ncbi:unnamed protein product [Lactuca virosa]|uniref:Mediator of RNA polymerase II transcription subunit 7 n=1 Tax=Lactuca virosa TaxID=75947 RepID=A0AAU9NVJ0_9ASTR|nr:unnamed protein product [Lactuca virosa]
MIGLKYTPGQGPICSSFNIDGHLLPPPLAGHQTYHRRRPAAPLRRQLLCADLFPSSRRKTYYPTSAPEPPPPIQGTYLLYGANYTTDDVLPSLEDQGVRQLYPKGPNVDFKKELRSLNRELQLHILELADVLIERPSQYARRVEDISLIFKNLHHLLNSLRPHQARATLIHILELQIQRRKQAVEDIKRRREEAQRLLKEALGTLEGQ